jgi:hypothetical protein
MVIASLATFTTLYPVFTSMPFLPNLSSAKLVILLSNLHNAEKNVTSLAYEAAYMYTLYVR